MALRSPIASTLLGRLLQTAVVKPAPTCSPPVPSRSFSSSGTTAHTASSPKPSFVTHLSNTRHNLEFSVESAAHCSASANLAFLERDPTERGPRAQFQLEATTIAKSSIEAAIRNASCLLDDDATRGLEADPYRADLRELFSLVVNARGVVLHLETAIAAETERLHQIANGPQL